MDVDGKLLGRAASDFEYIDAAEVRRRANDLRCMAGMEPVLTPFWARLKFEAARLEEIADERERLAKEEGATLKTKEHALGVVPDRVETHKCKSCGTGWSCLVTPIMERWKIVRGPGCDACCDDRPMRESVEPVKE